MPGCFFFCLQQLFCVHTFVGGLFRYRKSGTPGDSEGDTEGGAVLLSLGRFIDHCTTPYRK